MIAFPDSSISMDATDLRLERFRALKSQIETCNDSRQTLELARSLYALAQDLPQDKRAEAAFILGTHLNDCDHFEAALIALEEARSLQIGTANALATTLDMIGFVKQAQGEYPQAMTVLLEALVQAKIAADPGTEAMVLNSIAMVYSDLSDINNSLEYQLLALEAYRRSGQRLVHWRIIDVTGGPRAVPALGGVDVGRPGRTRGDSLGEIRVGDVGPPETNRVSNAA